MTTIFSTTTPAGSSTASQGASSTTPGGLNPTDSPSGGLTNAGTIAVAVVVPIVAVGLLVVAALFFWRRRKQRKDAEEQRRKEVEDYGYNPNADPTIPAVAGAGAGAYEMREDASGYRGWGSTTLAGSTGRKASTTMSGGGGGGGGVAYSDATSPTRGAASDGRSAAEPLMNEGSPTQEGEILGAMGPSAANNQSNVRRGPSNASSSYSAAGRSDGSGEGIGVAYGGNPNYYDQYGNNPYSDAPYNNNTGANGNSAGPNRQGPQEMAGQPVIRDVAARRNTRIENNAHFPQQTAGISQNF